MARRNADRATKKLRGDSKKPPNNQRLPAAGAGCSSPPAVPPSPASGAALPAPSAVRSELPAVASSRYSRFQARQRKNRRVGSGDQRTWVAKANGGAFYLRVPAQLRSGGLAWRGVARGDTLCCPFSRARLGHHRLPARGAKHGKSGKWGSRPWPAVASGGSGVAWWRGAPLENLLAPRLKKLAQSAVGTHTRADGHRSFLCLWSRWSAVLCCSCLSWV